MTPLKIRYYAHMTIMILSMMSALVLLLAESFYFNPSNPIAMLSSGAVVLLAIVLTKNLDMPIKVFFQRGVLPNQCEYLVAFVVGMLVISGMNDSGLSDHPVRLIALGAIYVALKHMTYVRSIENTGELPY